MKLKGDLDFKITLLLFFYFSSDFLLLGDGPEILLIPET